MRPMWKINVCSASPSQRPKTVILTQIQTHTSTHALLLSRSFVHYKSIRLRAEFFVLFSFELAFDYFIVFLRTTNRFWRPAKRMSENISANMQNANWSNSIRFESIRNQIKSNQTKYNNKFSCGGGGSDTNGIGYYKIITSNEKGEKRPKREQEHQQIWNNLTAVTRSTIFTEIYIQHTYMHAHAVYTPNVYIISISSCVFHARHIYMLFCAHLNFFWLNSTHWFASTRTHTDTDTHRHGRSYDMLLPLLTEFLRQRRVLLISKVLCWHSSVGILCVRVRIGRW